MTNEEDKTDKELKERSAFVPTPVDLAVEEPSGVPEAWREGKGVNYYPWMPLLQQQRGM